jgi:hypothetical protein
VAAVPSGLCLTPLRIIINEFQTKESVNTIMFFSLESGSIRLLREMSVPNNQTT